MDCSRISSAELLSLLSLATTTYAIRILDPTANVFAAGVPSNSTIPSSTTTSSSTTVARVDPGGLLDIAALPTTSTSSIYAAVLAFVTPVDDEILLTSSASTAATSSATDPTPNFLLSFAETTGDLLPASSVVGGSLSVLGQARAQSVQLASAVTTPTTTSSSTTAARGDPGDLPDIATRQTTNTSSSYASDASLAFESFAKMADGGLLITTSTTSESVTRLTETVAPENQQSYAKTTGDLLPASSAPFGSLGDSGVLPTQLADTESAWTTSTTGGVTVTAVDAEPAEAENTGTTLSEAEILAGCSSNYQGHFDFIQVRLDKPKVSSEGLKKRAFVAPNSPYRLTNGVLQDRNLDTGFLTADSVLVYSKVSPNGSTFTTNNWSACYSVAEGLSYLAYGKSLSFYDCAEGYSLVRQPDCVDIEMFLELADSEARPPVTSATVTATGTFTPTFILLPSFVKDASVIVDADNEGAPSATAKGNLRSGGVPATPNSSPMPTLIGNWEFANPTDALLPPITTTAITASVQAFVTPDSRILVTTGPDTSPKLEPSFTTSIAQLIPTTSNPHEGSPSFADPVENLVSSSTHQPANVETSGPGPGVPSEAGPPQHPPTTVPRAQVTNASPNNSPVVDGTDDDAAQQGLPGPDHPGPSPDNSNSDKPSGDDDGGNPSDVNDKARDGPSTNDEDHSAKGPGERLVDAIASAAETTVGSTNDDAFIGPTAVDDNPSPQPGVNAATDRPTPNAGTDPSPRAKTTIFTTDDLGVNGHPPVTTVVRSTSNTAFTFTVALATTAEPLVAQVYRTSQGSVFSFDVPVVAETQNAIPTTAVRTVDGSEVTFTFTPAVVQTDVPTATTVATYVDGMPTTLVLGLPFAATVDTGPAVTTAVRTVGDSILSFTLTQPYIEYSVLTATTITTQIDDRLATLVLPLPSVRPEDNGLDITTAVRTLGTSVLSFTLTAPVPTLVTGGVTVQETTILRTLEDGSTATFVVTLPSASPSGVSSSSHPGIGELIMNGLGGVLAAQETSSGSTSLGSLLGLTAVPTASAGSTSSVTTSTFGSTSTSPAPEASSNVPPVVDESGAARGLVGFGSCWLLLSAFVVWLLRP